MPEKVVLENGTEREVPTAEELKNLQAGHDANLAKKPIVEEFNKVREELGVEEGASLADKIAVMKEESNPNWQKARAKISAMEKVLNEQGVKVKDDGTVVKKEEITQEELAKTTESLVDKKFADKEREVALSQFNSEERKSVEPLLNKLMAVDGKLKENIAIVTEKLFPDRKADPVQDAFYNTGGSPPVVKTAGKIDPTIASSFGITEEDLNKYDK